MKHKLLIFFILLIALCESKDDQVPRRTYVVRRDLLDGYKASEYSVYDGLEKTILYRIETEFSFRQKLELISYPSLSTTARLEAIFRRFNYKANFTIFDRQTNQWIDGEMQRHFNKFDSSLFIHWNNANITLITKSSEITVKFRDSQENLLANFRVRLGSIVWATKYDLNVYTDAFPDEIYLLGLARYERVFGTVING